MIAPTLHCEHAMNTLKKTGTILKRHLKKEKIERKHEKNGDGAKLATKNIRIGDKNGRNWRLECHEPF